MKNKKSAGADDIPAFVLRRVLHIIIKPLAFLVNLSFSSGIFPVYLKTGKVTPIYKKEDSTLLENYRPVTTPDSLSKAFEYAFCDRFLNFLNKENILTPRQHGFRLGKSTSTALLTFYDELINFIDAGECPAAIFCDLSRAFDCVNHKKLLYILESYGLRGVSLSWISSFLTNRSQYVSLRYETEHLILNATSEFRPVQMGVPQGSVLGPVLFLLYVNQLESAISHPHFIMYADDVSLLISAKNSENVINKCEQVVTAACNYFNELDLHFNTTKTQVLRFHTYQKVIEPLKFIVNNTILQNKQTDVKFLGVYMDECLSWKPHCTQLISKLSSITYIFLNLRVVLHQHQLISVYYAQVESRLRYGVCLWGNSAMANDVFTAQKRILRCIGNIPKTHTCRNIFCEYKILTLTCLYILEISVYVFSNKGNFQLNKDIHDVNTRQKDLMHVPLAKYKIAHNSPSHIGTRIFNHLPDYIKSSKNVNLFKNKLRLFLLERCFYTLTEFFSV